MKQSMIIYRSFYDAIKDLPKENQAELWEAVFKLGFEMLEIELTGLNKTIFTLIRPQIEANNKKFVTGSKFGHLGAEHGKKGGRPKPSRNPQETLTGGFEITPIEPANVNDNVNDNVNEREKRKLSFAHSLKSFVSVYGREMMNEFFAYWTEPNKNGEMRFELEKTWSTETRLKKWKKNEKNNPKGTKTDSFIQNYMNPLM